MDDYVVETTKLRKLSVSNNNASEQELILDANVDAYVLNKASLELVSKASINSYLVDGGIIVVNDNDVTSNDLSNKVETKVANFDYSEEVNQYGFYVYYDGEENKVVNVSLGFVEEESTTFVEEALIVEDVVDKEVIVEDMVTSASTRAFNELADEGGGGGGTPVETETSGQVIAYANLENLLYNQSSGGELVSSYTIYTQVIDVAKITNENSTTIRGMYDISSTFTVDAEPDWAVYEYSTRMYSSSEILDASFLQSQTSTTVSLGGSVGFQGNVLVGDINAGVSYTYSGTSQDIVNDLPAGHYKYWYSTLPSRTKNASYQLKPAIRVINSNDIYNTSEKSRVDSFKITNNGWWIFEKKMYMGDAYRKELKITWNSYGFVSDLEITG